MSGLLIGLQAAPGHDVDASVPVHYVKGKLPFPERQVIHVRILLLKTHTPRAPLQLKSPLLLHLHAIQPCVHTHAHDMYTPHAPPQIKSPLLLVNFFMQTSPELIPFAQTLLSLTSQDFMGRSSFLHRQKQFLLMEYLTEGRAEKVRSSHAGAACRL